MGVDYQLVGKRLADGQVFTLTAPLYIHRVPWGISLAHPAVGVSDKQNPGSVRGQRGGGLRRHIHRRVFEIG